MFTEDGVGVVVFLSILWEQGWRSGESTRLPPMWPRSTPSPGIICGLSLLLVLVLAPTGFSPGPPVFLPP